MFNPMQIMSMVSQMGKNPQAIIQNMANQNPNVNALLNQARQSGMTPKEFAQQFSKQNNIDLSPIINVLNQMGIRF